MGSKYYTPDEILKMAVKKIAVDMAADLDGDGEVTAADARAAARGSDAPKAQKEEASQALRQPEKSVFQGYKPDENLSLMSSSVLDKLMNYKGSDLELNADKLYNSYRDMYAKNAALSAENVYGLASSLTGGYGNSYAASAASAAFNSFMNGLADRALEIEQLNDSRKKTELNDLYNVYTAVNELENRNYSRYRDSLSLAFEAAKQGDYSLLERYGIDTSKLRSEDDLKLAEQAAKYGDYSYLEELGIDTDPLYDKESLQMAVRAAEYGDYSYLEKLGVNTSLLKYNELLKTAAQIAEYGDYSALELLGVDVSSLIEDEELEKALALAKYGDYSLLGTFSGNLSGIRQKISSTVQNGAQEAYAYGGYSSLVKYLNKQVGFGQINENAKKQIISVVTGGKYGA